MTLLPNHGWLNENNLPPWRFLFEILYIFLSLIRRCPRRYSPEEGCRLHQPKCCEYDNQNENSRLNDSIYQSNFNWNVFFLFWTFVSRQDWVISYNSDVVGKWMFSFWLGAQNNHNTWRLPFKLYLTPTITIWQFKGFNITLEFESSCYKTHIRLFFNLLKWLICAFPLKQTKMKILF